MDEIPPAPMMPPSPDQDDLTTAVDAVEARLKAVTAENVALKAAAAKTQAAVDRLRTMAQA